MKKRNETDRLALALKMWGLLEEVTFEPKSGTRARGQGKSLRGAAFQAEGTAWVKVLRCKPAWHWKKSWETGVAGVSEHREEAGREERGSVGGGMRV